MLDLDTGLLPVVTVLGMPMALGMECRLHRSMVMAIIRDLILLGITVETENKTILHLFNILCLRLHIRD